MAFYPCLQAVSTPSPSNVPSIELLQTYTITGDSTYTIPSAGTYMFIVSNSYQGTRGITLPAGRTAIIDEDIEPSSGNIYGTTVVIATLQAEDVVTLSATISSWLAFSKLVYKINDVTSFSVYGKQAGTDGLYTYTLPSSGSYLLIGVCFGIDYAHYYDSSDLVMVYGVRFNEAQTCKTMVNVYYGNGSTIPQQQLYGYDGGGVDFLALSITM